MPRQMHFNYLIKSTKTLVDSVYSERRSPRSSSATLFSVFSNHATSSNVANLRTLITIIIITIENSKSTPKIN